MKLVGSIKELEGRVECLGLSKWQDNVRLSLYRAITANGTGGVWVGKAKAQLRLFEEIERLSLLELAIWKFSCLDTPPLKNLLELVQWQNEGWKTNKVNRRDDVNAIFVIITHVLPFLGERQ